MNRCIPFLLALSLSLPLVFCTGCLTVYSPAIGVLYTDVSFPSQVTPNGAADKSASATAKSFFGIFAHGDCSVDAIARKAGITKVHHVDTHVTNLLGYGTMEVTVYGE